MTRQEARARLRRELDGAELVAKHDGHTLCSISISPADLRTLLTEDDEVVTKAQTLVDLMHNDKDRPEVAAAWNALRIALQQLRGEGATSRRPV